MAMNLSNINSTPIQLNLTIFTDDEMVKNVAAAADTGTNGMLGVFILTILYVFMVYELSKEIGLFRLDKARASLTASGFVFALGIVLSVPGLITAFYSVIWFGLIFLISLVAVFNKSERGA